MNHVKIYEDPETSEIKAEFASLEEALGFVPMPQAEIISRGYVLAREKEGQWQLTRYADQKELWA